MWKSSRFSQKLELPAVESSLYQKGVLNKKNKTKKPHLMEKVFPYKGEGEIGSSAKLGSSAKTARN